LWVRLVVRRRPPKIDWGAAFHEWVRLPADERVVAKFARRKGVNSATVFRHMKKDGWLERAAEIEAEAERKAKANSIRSVTERKEDVIRLAMAVRTRYAQRLRDDFSYKITATEVAALTRIEMLVEGRDTEKVGVRISEETKERLALLSVYVQERMLLAAATGASMEEILEVEGILDAEEDAELRTSGSGSREAGKERA
jgi:hypothetical protein